MTEPCFGAYRGIWSCFGIILFFMCLVHAVITGFALIGLIYADWDLSYLPGEGTKTIDYITAISALILDLGGAYASFFYDRTSLLIFSFATGLNFLLAVVLLILKRALLSPRIGLEEVSKILWDKIPLYSWDHKSETAKNREATELWDILQKTLGCCGVDGPFDWVPYRPSMSSEYKYAYPSSCCTNSMGRVCEGQEIVFKGGCYHTIKIILFVGLLLRICNLLYILLLSAISCMLGFCAPKAQEQSRYPGGQIIYPGQYYQQSPVSQQGYQSAPKQLLPPMYPNLHGSGNNYPAQPPSPGPNLTNLQRDPNPATGQSEMQNSNTQSKTTQLKTTEDNNSHRV